MALGSGHQPSMVASFSQTYRRLGMKVMLEVEREVIGANVGANGYTTIDWTATEAGLLRRALLVARR